MTTDQKGGLAAYDTLCQCEVCRIHRQEDAEHAQASAIAQEALEAEKQEHDAIHKRAERALLKAELAAAAAARPLMAGDVVRSPLNPEWGDRDMTVEEVEPGWVYCRHPDPSLVKGGFRPDELRLVKSGMPGSQAVAWAEGDLVRCDDPADWSGVNMEITRVISPFMVVVQHPTQGISTWTADRLTRAPVWAGVDMASGRGDDLVVFMSTSGDRNAGYRRYFGGAQSFVAEMLSFQTEHSWPERMANRIKATDLGKSDLGTPVAPAKGLDSLDGLTSSQRKQVPIATGVIDYFPDALAAVAAVSKVGGEQHNPGQPLFWDRTKSTDEADCLMRHFVDRGTFDTDGMRHSAKVAWRALALLQKEIEHDAEMAEDEAFYRDLVGDAKL